jgi:Tn3 transposase DDE domain
MVNLRDRDVHFGDMRAETLPKMMELELHENSYSQHDTALFGPRALTEHKNPNGVTVLVIGWTSLQIQAALAALKSRGIVFSPEVLRHVSPIRYRNSNFRGTFKFPFEKYLVALLGEDASAHGKSMHG